ncbi:MAG: SufB/SufD family protein [Candidatus Brocadiia bacterium]
MSTDYEMMVDLYERLGQDSESLTSSDIAHVVVHENEVLGANLVPGLLAETEELDDGVALQVTVEEGMKIDRTVHMCFGVLPEQGLQKIILDVGVEEMGSVDILAHCVFPNAVDIRHEMEAEIRVEDGASYRYEERHVHGNEGGVVVLPEARVELGEGAHFETEFELIEGRVGEIDIDYETRCAARSSLRMVARISGRKDDRINIREIGHLEGEDSAGALLSRVAVRDQAVADIYNELTASAPGARGHVDCKEVVQGEAVAKATPVVDVRDPLARVTHEAAIGSVDSKQLQTLMARGMDEEEAVDLIVQGMLRGE